MRAVEAQLRAGPLEVNIAGDVDPAELDAMLVRFLGTAAPGALTPQLDVAPLDLTPLALRDVAPGDVAARAQRMWLRDSDERACAALAGPGRACGRPCATLPCRPSMKSRHQWTRTGTPC